VPAVIVGTTLAAFLLTTLAGVVGTALGLMLLPEGVVG